MITSEAQHKLNPAAKKTEMLVKFRPQSQLQIISKRPDQYDNFLGSNNTRTLQPKNRYFVKILIYNHSFKKFLRDQYDHFQGSKYIKPFSQKMYILAKF